METLRERSVQERATAQVRRTAALDRRALLARRRGTRRRPPAGLARAVGATLVGVRRVARLGLSLVLVRIGVVVLRRA